MERVRERWRGGAAVFLHCSALLFFRQSCADYWRTGICNFGCNGTGDFAQEQGQTGWSGNKAALSLPQGDFAGCGSAAGIWHESGKRAGDRKRIAADYSEYNFYLADCGLCFTEVLKVSPKIATLVGVGSSICGGSAIAATAPVIGADDEEIAQAISVIFLFNVIAALVFPGTWKRSGIKRRTVWYVCRNGD